MHRLVALLPFKAHSERVPGKNFREFAGKPLFRWMLDKLLAVQEIDLVVVNTDAEHILADVGLVSRERLLIRPRAPQLCGDFVSMNLIIADDVQAVPADTYLMTHTTNPLLSVDFIRRAIDRFREAHIRNEADSLFSVTKFQLRFYGAHGEPINHDPKNLIRTQDLIPWFAENSNLYLFTRDSFSQTSARIGARPLLMETSTAESIDIDTQEDWDLAELVAEGLQRRNQREQT